MKLTITKCFENSEVTGIVIDPLVINIRAIKFYQKLGFEFVKNRYFDEDYCAVYKLERPAN
jgi:aminoglycoside 6'-N-acetyltransferase